MIQETKAYQLIQAHYGTQTAKRSGVLLMNHIDEGLRILEALNASSTAKEAFCIHPLLQADEDLVATLSMNPEILLLDPLVLVCAIEYRSVANAYLSNLTYAAEPRLSPLHEVNQMLIADKVQNCKDFEQYHEGTHHNSVMLALYFRKWLQVLGVPKGSAECRRLEALCS